MYLASALKNVDKRLLNQMPFEMLQCMRVDRNRVRVINDI